MPESNEAEAIAALVVLVKKMVVESGNAEGFDTAQWLKTWLSSPLPALGGACPHEWMGTAEGRARVADLLAMIQSGALA